MREFDVKGILNSSKISVATLLGSVIFLIAARCFGAFVSISSHRVSSVFCLLLVSFIGWIMLYSFSRISSSAPRILGSMVRYMGKHSLSILIFHFLAFRIVNAVGVWLHHDPPYMIAGNPTAYYGPIWTALYTLVGIAFPLVVAFIYQCLREKYIHSDGRE